MHSRHTALGSYRAQAQAFLAKTAHGFQLGCRVLRFRPWPVLANPASLVPLGSSRFVPSFSLAAVKRNFLLGSIRNFSLGRYTVPVASVSGAKFLIELLVMKVTVNVQVRAELWGRLSLRRIQDYAR
jgi:hypothetical protein